MRDRVSLLDLKKIWNEIRSVGSFSINIINESLEFKFQSSEITDIISFVENIAIVENKGRTFFSITKKNDARSIVYFKDLNSLFNYIRLNKRFFDNSDFFVFDYNECYLHYDHETKELISNYSDQYTSSLLEHYLSYSRLLEIFKSNIPKLVELDRPIEGENELIVLSKGTENFITNIKYKQIDDSIFHSAYARVPIEEFYLKLINEEWVASFKNVLCNYMELQSESLKTFATIYKNLTYLFNQTNKNYDLFVSKFSFDKIRKQFKVEKNAYFDTLNNAQDKITGQIVSVPISLGASIFSFYQLSANYKTILLVYVAIAIYSLFISCVICGYLRDINKLSSDVNDEENNLKSHFPDLANDFKKDFLYMRSKRRYIRFMGLSIVVALFITLIAITYYIIHFSPNSEKSSFHYFVI